MDKIKLVTFLFLIINSFVFGQDTFKHKVIAGETLYAIARNNNCSVATIYELNPKIKGKTLQTNTILYLPNKNRNSTVAVAVDPTEKKSYHIVLKGDSFFSIASKYGISVSQLEDLNPTIKPKRIKEGMIVKLEKPQEEVMNEGIVTNSETVKTTVKEQKPIVTHTNTATAKDSTFLLLHIIQPKETRYGISKKYGITIHELESLNPSVPADFPVGYELIIKKDKSNALVENTGLSYDEEEMVEEMAKDFNSKADFLVDKASQYIGIKYKYGGTTPNGFDCSGLMCTTFKEIDLSLPRTSSAQATYGEKIKMKESQKGDLIFFATGRKNRISHVGMITEVNEDEIKFIHASTSSGVMISSSKEPYYADRIIQVNRVLNE